MANRCIRYSVGRFFLLTAAVALLNPGCWDVRAQEIVPEFTVDAISVRSDNDPSMARVDLYTRLPYRQLSFINTPNGFSSSYEVTVDAVHVSDGGRVRNLVNSKIWDADVVVDTYIQTQLDELSDFTTQAFELNPGSYVFEFELADKNSNQIYVRQLPVVVPDYSVATSISNITFLDSYDSETFEIKPRVDHIIGTDEGGFQIFYEVYSDNDRGVSVRREIIPIPNDTQAGLLDAESILPGDIYDETETIRLAEGKSQFLDKIPVEELKAGSYQVRVRVQDESGRVLAETSSRFVAWWTGLDSHIDNMDDAITQLEYIAKKKDITFIKNASSELERNQRFRSFWEKRDPTPGTKRNERMEEYYYRVDSANKHYGAVQDGWKTDRGFVYVRFGEPDHIRRKAHSFNFEPYEVWIYERMGRQFIFIDKTGFGDYELLVPIWDERTKLY